MHLLKLALSNRFSTDRNILDYACRNARFLPNMPWKIISTEFETVGQALTI